MTDAERAAVATLIAAIYAAREADRPKRALLGEIEPVTNSIPRIDNLRAEAHKNLDAALIEVSALIGA